MSQPNNSVSNETTLPLKVTLSVPPAESVKAGTSSEPEIPIESHHEIVIDGRRLRYTVQTGFLPILSDAGVVEAKMFFVAYTLDPPADPAKRPLIISFNGGPGSASVWLHLGALGPKRVKMLPDGGLPPPPYQIVDNPETWLEEADLVFVDPVGTGYSRPATPELGEKFWSLQGDIKAMGDFIRLYLSRYSRWSSPLFLAGESYGTTRAAGLSNHLLDRGIALNGILLVSSILNFQTAELRPGNDLPAILFLPTYTATAWYHHRLSAEQQARELPELLQEVEEWALTDYSEALNRGASLSTESTQAIAARLADYTGLSQEYIERSDLRIEIFRFCRELLHERALSVGRLDSRFTGSDRRVSETPEFDPSMTAIRPPYTAMFNQYVREELGLKLDREYYILGEGFDKWEWGSAGEGYPDTAEALRQAFVKNPYMRLFIASGYYDLATPYFATRYTLNHMGLDHDLLAQVRNEEYVAGHMMYIDVTSLAKLKNDVIRFLQEVLPG